MGGKNKKAMKKEVEISEIIKESKGRLVRSFPASTFEEALVIGQAIQQFAAGQKIRRLTLFDNLGKTSDSGPSRQLVTNSSRYGVTKGGYQAEYLELTEVGKIATSQDIPKTEQLKAKFKLAIEQIPPFNILYDRFKGNKLPAQSVLRDVLIENGFKEVEVSECVDTFVLNVKFLGILRTVAGAERLLPIEHASEEIEKVGTSISPSTMQVISVTKGGAETVPEKTEDWDCICFYITPIGEPESEARQHSDLFLSSIVEPALEEFKLKLVRADQISEAGMITRQVIEHVVNSRLVIADLSYHNPNVFYELSLRHACRKPTVQLIRMVDRIPFDLDQFRTIKVDTTSIYTLVPKIETYKSEIANQVRRALSDPDAVDNPISVFFPRLKMSLS